MDHDEDRGRDGRGRGRDRGHDRDRDRDRDRGRSRSRSRDRHRSRSRSSSREVPSWCSEGIALEATRRIASANVRVPLRRRQRLVDEHQRACFLRDSARGSFARTQAVFERHQGCNSESLAANGERVRVAERGFCEAREAQDAALANDFRHQLEVARLGVEVTLGRRIRALREFENFTSRLEVSVGNREAAVLAAWNALEADRAAGGSPVPTLVPAPRP
jgi:hypothetical protein